MFNDESQETTPETVVEEVVETSEEVVEAPVETDWEAEAKRLQAELGKTRRLATKAEKKVAVPSDKLAVEDFIDISTSLDGLDVREKAFLAEQHKLSGKPLKTIREGEDFQLWQSAYRSKMETEKALRPSATQAVEDAPKSAAKLITSAKTLSEQEELLKQFGLYKETRPRADKTTIGAPRSL